MEQPIGKQAELRAKRLETAQRVADEGGTLADLANALGVTRSAIYDSVFMWRPDLRKVIDKNAVKRENDQKKDRIILIALACLDVLSFRQVAEVEGVSVPAITNFRDRHCGWRPLEWLAKHYGPELPARLVRAARKHQRPPTENGERYAVRWNPHYFEDCPFEIDVEPVALPAYIDGTSESQPVQNFD